MSTGMSDPSTGQLYDLNEGTQGQPYGAQQQAGGLAGLYGSYNNALFGGTPNIYQPNFGGTPDQAQQQMNQDTAQLTGGPQQQPYMPIQGQQFPQAPQQGIGQMGMNLQQLQQQGLVKPGAINLYNQATPTLTAPQQMTPSPITQANGMTFPTAPPVSAGNPRPVGQNGSPFVGGLPSNTLPTSGLGAQQIQAQLANPNGGTPRPVNQQSTQQVMNRLGLNQRLPSPGPVAPQIQPLPIQSGIRPGVTPQARPSGRVQIGAPINRFSPFRTK